VHALGLEVVVPRQREELGRRAAVVVAADLDLGVAGVAQHLERARQVELVVGEQVADREQLDPDPLERQVAALAEAVVLVVVPVAVPAPVVVVPASCQRRSAQRPQRPDRRRPAGGAQEAAAAQAALVVAIDHVPLLLCVVPLSPRVHRLLRSSSIITSASRSSALRR